MATGDEDAGRIKEKLVATKERWAREGRLLTGTHGDPGRDRLPPGQRLVRDWPVLDLGVQPNVPRERWRLDVLGAVENPVSWNLATLEAAPQVEMVSDIHCVTAWSRYDNRWQGVSAARLLAVVRPKPEATHILFHSYDGYTTNVSLADFAADDVLLAHHWEGAPLTREHGGPVRVVIPKRYFWKSPKWIRQIDIRAGDKPGYWEVRGYHNEADPWAEERYG